MNTVLGLKKEQSQKFLTDGTRIPVTVVEVHHNPVVAIKSFDKHGYCAIQLGYGMRKNSQKNKNITTTEGKEEKTTPRFLYEVRLANDIKMDSLPEVGEMIEIATVLKPGDVIDVTGVSKGKGFAGGVKRWGFHGGPRTHGQSDRERAPGSIGQTTTPGRVYRGKKMAGKMGHEQVTVRNLEVVAVDGITLLIKGLVPGPADNLLVIKKVGEKKNVIPMVTIEPKEAEQITENAEAVPILEEGNKE